MGGDLKSRPKVVICLAKVPITYVDELKKKKHKTKEKKLDKQKKNKRHDECNLKP